MILDETSVLRYANQLVGELDALNDRTGAIGKVRRYLQGDHDLPYMPRGATTEYRQLAKRAITNWLPLITETFTKALFVDGFRAGSQADNATPWGYWQANGLDSRQSIVYKGAIKYGTAYVLVLPGNSTPVIKPLRATRSVARYEDDDADWPEVGLYSVGKTVDGARIFDVYDEVAVWRVVRPKGSTTLYVTTRELHNLGVTPLVRFRDNLDDESVGVVAPLIGLQDRINETVFSLLIALQFASFRQRWATGLAIPTDGDQFLPDGVTANPNFGKPVQPFKSAIDRLWVAPDSDVKFGDFEQTNTSGHLEAYHSAVRTLSAIGQTPPGVLLGDLINMSAEALAASEAGTQRKVGEFETLFGESWEQVLRLAAKAAGDDVAAADTSAEVRWRDTEARTLAATVDALGKMAQMLGVPAEAIWERIPGVTDQDIERWRDMRNSGDVFGDMLANMQRQTTLGA
jgi:hypothetical protein